MATATEDRATNIIDALEGMIHATIADHVIVDDGHERWLVRGEEWDRALASVRADLLAGTYSDQATAYDSLCSACTGAISLSRYRLMAYDTAESIRPATPAEVVASRIAAEADGGAGVIAVDGRSCYVED